MTERRDPRPGEIWQDKRGKRRVVALVRAGCVKWYADGNNHGHADGTMFLTTWHRKGWTLAEEAPHE